MIWIAVLLFAGAGIFSIVRRNELARGYTMTVGGTIAPWAIVLQGVIFLAIAAGFWLGHAMGLIGAR